MGGLRILVKAGAWFAGGASVSSGLLLMTRSIATPGIVFGLSLGACVVFSIVAAALEAGREKVNRLGLPTHSTPGVRIATDAGWQPLDVETPHRVRRVIARLAAVSMLLLGCAAGCVLSVGSVERARVLAGEVATSGYFQPMWKSELLDWEVARLDEQFANREVTQVSLTSEHLLVDAVSATNPNRVDSYRVASGRVEFVGQNSRGGLNAFRLNQINVDAVRTATATIYADDPDADILSLFISDWIGGPLTITALLDAPDGFTSREFNGDTGEEISLQEVQSSS